jgi:pimeloyl-ACP methyl ester carboxylesterase
MSLAVVGAITGGVAICALAALCAVGVKTARRLVLGGPVRYVSVLNAGDVIAPGGTVRLGIDAVTTVPGHYALEFDNGERVLIEDVLSVDHAAGTVDRLVVKGEIPAGATRARFTGTTLTMEDFPRASLDDRTPSGAWRFDAGATSDTWVIHVHGLGASPQSTLRSVRTVEKLGVPSLVVSFGQPFEARRVGLASDDIDRVVAAIDDAVSLGARRVILCGWSFGAAVCLAAARKRPEAVTGAILVSPMISLARAAYDGARRTGRSRVPVMAAFAALSVPLLARCAGVRGALGIRALSRGVPHGLPVLALHSAGDRLLPIESTRRASDATDQMTLIDVPDAVHGLEWNRDARQFESAIQRWMESINADAWPGEVPPRASVH